MSRHLGISAAALVIANLVPLVGVALFGWETLDLLLLYWAENVLIGLINVLRMLVARVDFRPILVPFFAVHYGLFCYGHYLAVVSIFADLGQGGIAVPANWPGDLRLAVAAIGISHLVSFGVNFVAGGEYLRSSTASLMRRPYGRIVVLHVTVIAGGFVVSLSGNPVWMLVALVLVKTAIDFRLHARERAVLGSTMTGTGHAAVP